MSETKISARIQDLPDKQFEERLQEITVEVNAKDKQTLLVLLAFLNATLVKRHVTSVGEIILLTEKILMHLDDLQKEVHVRPRPPSRLQ